MTARSGSQALPFVRSFVRWESLLGLVVIALIWLGASVSPVFLSAQNFSNLMAAVIEGTRPKSS